MRELSLFTGAGGGLLGTKLLNWRPVGYVEYNEYCQQIIAQRIRDRMLEEAPIFGNINAFIRDGYAASYTGLVDVITAGFPCQPFSVAGKGLGEADPRNKWPETLECLRVVRPRFAYLENVPGLFAHDYTRTIFRQLAEAGFNARWCVLGADDCGAPHRRKRVWIHCTNTEHDGSPSAAQPGGHRSTVCWSTQGQDDACEFARMDTPPNVADAARKRCGEAREYSQRCEEWAASGSEALADAKRERRERRPWELSQQTGRDESSDSSSFDKRRWPAEPGVGRVANGVAYRVDRLKALGNGQVSRVVKAAWRVLSQ